MCTGRSPPPSSGDLPTERAGTATVAVGGPLIVLGGESGRQRPAHAEVAAFNPETGRWRTLPPLHTGRHGTQAIVHEGFMSVWESARGQ